MASGQLIQTQVDIEEVEKALAGTSKSLKAIRKSVLRIAAKETAKRVKAAISASDLHRRTGELAKAYVYKVKIRKELIKDGKLMLKFRNFGGGSRKEHRIGVSIDTLKLI